MVDDLVEAGNGGKRMNTGSVFFKTKLCSRFRSGNCPYITNCNFAHGADELRRPPPGWEDLVNPPGFAEDSGGGGGGGGRGGGNATRFRPCKRFFTDGICPYGERCIFSHEDHSTVNAKPANWKTRLCNKWETTGSCSFGETCHFAHGSAELQKFGGGRESLPSPQRSQRSSSYSDSFSRPEASSSLTNNMPHPQQQKPQLQLHLQSPQQQNPIQHQQLQQQQNHHQSQQQPQIQTQKPQPPPTSSTSSKIWRGPTDSAISTIYGDWLEEEEDEDESEDELGANEDEENHPMELFYEELRSFN